MITIIHGDNIAVSRKQYIDLKQKSSASITLQGATLTMTDLAQTLESHRLFEDESDIFIEDFFSKRNKNKETDALISFIQEHHEHHTLVIWESKDLTPSQLKVFPKAILRKVDFPKILFTFLESIIPKQGPKAMQLYHELLKTEEAEFIFFMIVRHFRILLAILEGDEENQIDEIKRIAPWQRNKLEKQASLFGKKTLLSLYTTLFTIESRMKTGKRALPLEQTIDFFLAEL